MRIWRASAASLVGLKLAQKWKKPAVVGTTGFSAKQEREIAAIAKMIPIVRVPNYSVAVVGVAKKAWPLRQQDLELAEQRRKEHLRRQAQKLKSSP